MFTPAKDHPLANFHISAHLARLGSSKHYSELMGFFGNLGTFE